MFTRVLISFASIKVFPHIASSINVSLIARSVPRGLCGPVCIQTHTLSSHSSSHPLIPVLGRYRCEHCQTKQWLNLWLHRLEDCVWLIHACHHNQTRQTANLLNHLACYPPCSDFPSLFVSLSLITHSLRSNLAEAPLCHPCLTVLDRCVTNGLIMSPQPPCHQLNESWVNEHPKSLRLIYLYCVSECDQCDIEDLSLVLNWQSHFFAACLSFILSVVLSCCLFEQPIVHFHFHVSFILFFYLFSFVVCLLFVWLIVHSHFVFRWFYLLFCNSLKLSAYHLFVLSVHFLFDLCYCLMFVHWLFFLSVYCLFTLSLVSVVCLFILSVWLSVYHSFIWSVFLCLSICFSAVPCCLVILCVLSRCLFCLSVCQTFVCSLYVSVLSRFVPFVVLNCFLLSVLFLWIWLSCLPFILCGLLFCLPIFPCICHSCVLS